MKGDDCQPTSTIIAFRRLYTFSLNTARGTNCAAIFLKVLCDRENQPVIYASTFGEPFIVRPQSML